MALPGSGPISTAAIRTEIGGSGAVSIPSSEVRTLTGVASGPVALPGDFYGKSSASNHVDAVNWSNIYSTNSGFSETRTLTGFASSITLRLSFSGSTSGFSGYAYNVNGAGYNVWSNNTDISVSSGDTLQFLGSAGVPGADINGTISVINLSDSNATVDTFDMVVYYFEE